MNVSIKFGLTRGCCFAGEGTGTGFTICYCRLKVGESYGLNGESSERKLARLSSSFFSSVFRESFGNEIPLAPYYLSFAYCKVGFGFKVELFMSPSAS